MSTPHFATVPDVEPVVELGVGQTFGADIQGGRWDVAHWDSPTDAHWSGADPSWVDVTCDVRGVDSTVGHDRTLDAWDVGTCTVTVDNADGWADLTLDPLDPDLLDLRPGRAIRWGIRRVVPEVPGTPQVDGWLTPTVGTVSTPDPGPLPAESVWVIKFRYDVPLTAWVNYNLIRHGINDGNLAWRVAYYTGLYAQVTADGWTGRPGQSATDTELAAAGIVPGVDVWLAGTTDFDDGAGRLAVRPYASTDGTTWTPVSPGAAEAPAVTAVFDTAEAVCIGGPTDPWPGRIYSVELREGLDPAATIVPGYLTPTVGTVTTPDPGPLPAQCVFIFTERQTTIPTTTDSAVVSQDLITGNQRSWNLGRILSQGPNVWAWTSFTGGDGAGQDVRNTFVGSAPPTGADETFAVAFDQNAAGQRRFVTYRPDGAGGWTQIGTPVTAPTRALFDSSAPIRIGGYYSPGVNPWPGRIYSVELRTGLDPTAGTVVWRFDANDYPGTGTSYVDPRGRTWTLTTASAITPKRSNLVWRFDANDYPGGSVTSYVDPRGRTWTLTTAAAITPKVPGVPGVPAYVDTTWRFRGFIDAMRASYEGPHAETDTSILDCVDALGEVARVNLAKLAAPVGDGETVDARLHRILDAIGWRTEWRDIAASNVPLFATEYGAQAADLLGRTADTAAGALFGDYDGRVAFRNRDWQTWLPDAPPDLVLGNTAEATVCPSTIEVAFPRAGTTTRSLVNYQGNDGPPVQRDDDAAQLLYGVETAPERLDLQTDDPTQLDTLADRLLETRGVGTMPRVTALTLAAGRDEATMLACLDADPQRPSRWRLVVERNGRPLLDRMLLVTAVSHSWDAGGWHTSVRLDDASPWAAAGGRWDDAYWDAATWASGTDLVARLTDLLEALEGVA